MLWTTLVKPFCQYAAYKNSYKVGTFFLKKKTWLDYSLLNYSFLKMFTKNILIYAVLC